MVDLPNARRLLLRAEYERGDQSRVAHTVQLSEDAAFVWTEAPAFRGDRLVVRLSFPLLLAPITLSAKIVERFASADPGDPVGIVIDFDGDGPERTALREFLARIDAALATTPVIAEGRSPYRVLFVEDSDLLRDMFQVGALKYFRRKKGLVTVDLARDVEHAWSLLTQASYDMVLVDYFLPGAVGSDLVKRIRASESGPRTTCVGVSVGGDAARGSFLDAGADMYLDKPVVLQDLFVTLEALSVARAG